MGEAGELRGEGIGEAWCPGTCGELVQGSLDGQHFLITCPIDRFARARASLDGRPQGDGSSRGNDRVRRPVTWRYRGRVGWKVKAALERLLEEPGGGEPWGDGWPPSRWSGSGCSGSDRLPCGGDVCLELASELPRGAGMASSSAELAAALAATAKVLHIPLPPERILSLATAVEPTDGVMFPGIAVVDHRSGRLLERFPEPPALDLFIVNQGRGVDTMAFNARPDLDRLNRQKEPLVREAWELARQALRTADAEGLAAAATLSARAHQFILPRPELERCLRIGRQTGGLGLCIAHSGTVIGLLYPAGALADEHLCRYLADRLPGKVLGRARLIGGGIREPDLR